MSKQTVYVGMSGGVDSSVSAALLKEQGYEVVGVYMKNWSQDLPGFVCPWKEDYQDAMAVAVRLGIDLKLYDFQAEYRQKVVDYMLDEYKAGRTPNPDIICNQEVKFKLFLNTALEDGAELIATGHYARIERVKSQESRVKCELHMAKDRNKDQSYFLYRVTEQALNRTLFPIGEYTKPEVRELAKKLGLPVADKKDSQGICFVGKVGIKEFLQQYVETEPGPILNQAGKVIGEHDGAIFYTIGQRHGLSVGGGLPYYVVGKDMQKNEVHVTTDIDDNRLWHSSLSLTNIHWINDEPRGLSQESRVKSQEKLQARTRHRAPLVPISTLDFQGTTLEIALGEAVRAITPGQSAVLYDGERVLGGGIVI
jgi:tRNA-specific 2-thiouridylase